MVSISRFIQNNNFCELNITTPDINTVTLSCGGKKKKCCKKYQKKNKTFCKKCPKAIAIVQQSEWV